MLSLKVKKQESIVKKPTRDKEGSLGIVNIRKLLANKMAVGFVAFILLLLLPSVYWYLNGSLGSPILDRLAVNFFVPVTTTMITAVLFYVFSGVKDKLDEPSKISEFRETEKDAEKGDMDAQFNLGAMYKNGTGVKKDEAKAFYWYRKAGLGGHQVAQYNLGVLRRNGWGVPQDFIQSYKWHKIADYNGYGRAKRQLELLRNKMKPAEIEEAEELAKHCWESKYQDCGSE